MRRLTTCGLITFTGLLITAGCGDSAAPAATEADGESPPPARAEAAPPAGEAPPAAEKGGSLTLQSAGDEPRAAVRYAAEPGAVIRRRLSTAMRRDTSLDGKSFAEILPVMNLDLRSVTSEDSTGEEIHSTYIFTEHSVDEDPALVQQNVDMVRGMLSQAVGITREARMAPNGTVLDEKLNTMGLSREMRRHVEGLILAISSMTPVFPEQPIGSNAQWLVRQTVHEGDHTIDQTTSYRLMERDGDTVTLEYQVFRKADPQKLEKLEGAINQPTLLSYSAQGSGQIVLDLDEVLPVRGEGTMAVEATISMGEGRLNKSKLEIENKIGPVESSG